MIGLVAAFGVAAAVSAAAEKAFTPVSCDPEMRSIRWDGEAQGKFLQRSIQIVSLGLHDGPDTKLALLVSPDAKFSLGVNDMNMPLGTGVEGARRFARGLGGMTYTYDSLSGLPAPADGCAKQSFRVEFIAPDGRNLIDVRFEYVEGKLTSASGQTGIRESGSLDKKALR